MHIESNLAAYSQAFSELTLERPTGYDSHLERVAADYAERYALNMGMLNPEGVLYSRKSQEKIVQARENALLDWYRSYHPGKREQGARQAESHGLSIFSEYAFWVIGNKSFQFLQLPINLELLPSQFDRSVAGNAAADLVVGNGTRNKLDPLLMLDITRNGNKAGIEGCNKQFATAVSAFGLSAIPVELMSGKVIDFNNYLHILRNIIVVESSYDINGDLPFLELQSRDNLFRRIAYIIRGRANAVATSLMHGNLSRNNLSELEKEIILEKSLLLKQTLDQVI